MSINKQITLTNFNQLSDYTDINLFYTIRYNNENSSNEYFGKYIESMELKNNDAIIERLNVESVNFSIIDNKIINFVMISNFTLLSSLKTSLIKYNDINNISQKHGCSYTLARDMDLPCNNDDIRYDYIEIDNCKILVKYIKHKINDDEDNDDEEAEEDNYENDCDEEAKE